jgi:hypothetical protein
MTSKKKAEVNNFLGTCIDLVFGVINPVKKSLNATIYKCFRITIGKKVFSNFSFSDWKDSYVQRTNVKILRYKREKETVFVHHRNNAIKVCE